MVTRVFWNIDFKVAYGQSLKSSLPSLYGILVRQYNLGSSLGFLLSISLVA